MGVSAICMGENVASISYPPPLFHYHSCLQGPHGKVSRIFGESSDRSRPVPTGRVFGDPVLVVPSNAIYGKHQHVRFNMTLSNYTVCMAGKHAPKLSSNGNEWHLSFTTSDFGNGHRTSGVTYHGDLTEYVCASNHPSDCHHHQSHADVCSVAGGDSINMLKLHSDLDIWTLQDLMIYDRHLSDEEMTQTMEHMWERTHLYPCEPDEAHAGRRLHTGEHVEPLFTPVDDHKEAIRQAYIFNQTSSETFMTSISGLTIVVGGTLIVFMCTFRLVLIWEYYPRST